MLICAYVYIYIYVLSPTHTHTDTYIQREREKEREREAEREREREGEKAQEGGENGRRERETERKRERERQRKTGTERERKRESEREIKRERERAKEQEKGKERETDIETHIYLCKYTQYTLFKYTHYGLKHERDIDDREGGWLQKVQKKSSGYRFALLNNKSVFQLDLFGVGVYYQRNQVVVQVVKFLLQRSLERAFTDAWCGALRTLQCAACYSVLQCVAVCCRYVVWCVALRSVALHVLQRVIESVLECCRVSQRGGVRCAASFGVTRVAVCCSVL